MHRCGPPSLVEAVVAVEVAVVDEPPVEVLRVPVGVSPLVAPEVESEDVALPLVSVPEAVADPALPLGSQAMRMMARARHDLMQPASHGRARVCMRGAGTRVREAYGLDAAGTFEESLHRPMTPTCSDETEAAPPPCGAASRRTVRGGGEGSRA